MATLTEVSYFTRKGVKIALAFAVFVIIVPFIWKGVKKAYLTIFPPPPPPPTVRYGKLPKIILPESGQPNNLTYKLETVDGKLPKLASLGKVYFVEVNKSRLLELDRIKAKARTLGFTDPEKQIDDQNYEFVHPTLPATLKVNVIYDQYKYKYDWTTDQDVFSKGNIRGNEQAFLQAKSFFQSLDLLAIDLTEGTPKYTYFAARPPEMIPVASLSETDFIRVDLFRADLDKLRVVSPSANRSPVNITFSGNQDRGKSVVEANYTYSKIVDNDYATYPLKTVEQAWSELQQGGGYIAEKRSDQITVRKVSLAYFESDGPQEFLQPVFVFEGDNGFMAYVVAITPQYQQ